MPNKDDDMRGGEREERGGEGGGEGGGRGGRGQWSRRICTLVPRGMEPGKSAWKCLDDVVLLRRDYNEDPGSLWSCARGEGAPDDESTC